MLWCSLETSLLPFHFHLTYFWLIFWLVLNREQWLCSRFYEFIVFFFHHLFVHGWILSSFETQFQFDIFFQLFIRFCPFWKIVQYSLWSTFQLCSFFNLVQGSNFVHLSPHLSILQNFSILTIMSRVIDWHPFNLVLCFRLNLTFF